MKRVISLVPSLTETLIEAGVPVVGRTRYCLHPTEQASQIPIVGGTKDVRWSKVTPLGADLVILDREENPRRFAEQSPLPVFATHITGLENVGGELARLAEILQSPNLHRIADRWRAVRAHSRPPALLSPEFWQRFPGVIEWWKRPEEIIERVNYVIWREPWMCITPGTFIGSVLRHLGVQPAVELGAEAQPSGTLYPKFDLESQVSSRTLFLFSSEPYAFANHRAELSKLNAPSALVDGEKFSWFGVRALRFLESVHE